MIFKTIACVVAALQGTAANQMFLSGNQMSKDLCLKLNPWHLPENIDKNEKPVIGILSQTIDFTPHEDDHRFDNYSSYIMAAYVRFVEGAGARVVPFVYNEPEETTIEKLGKVNGVLFPGGAGDYMKIGKLVVEHAKKMNDEGKFFPLWGTCLGFEVLSQLTAKGDDILEKYGASHVSLPLFFKQDPRFSKMYCPMGLEAMRFQKEDFTINSHSFSIPPETFEKDEGLKEMWDVITVTYNADKKPFVSSIEGKKYPFMATQFHPEKVTQAWNDNYGINHSWESMHFNRFFADQFVSMARMSPSTFGNFTQTVPYLIDNYDLFETTYYAGELYAFK